MNKSKRAFVKLAKTPCDVYDDKARSRLPGCYKFVIIFASNKYIVNEIFTE